MKTMSRAVALLSGLGVTLVCTVGLASPASAAFDPGTVVGPTGWVPDGPVNSVLVTSDRVYIGGTFTGGVAAVDPVDGQLLWRSNANGDVRALAMANNGQNVIIGGAFTTVDGLTHRKLALLSASTGAADPWRGSAGGTVRDIVVSGDTAYFGGAFANHNGATQANLGAVKTTAGRTGAARVTSFTASTNGPVYSLALSGSRVIFGGKFTAVSGTGAAGPRFQLASFDTSSNTVDAWAPAAACTGCNLYWDLVVNGSTLYTASRNAGAVTAVDLATAGTANPTTFWRTPANGDAQALTFVGNELYVGGHFTAIGRGTKLARTIVASLDPSLTTTGGTVTGFSARFVTTFPGVWALGSTSTRLYVGGHFTAAGPAPNRYPRFAMFGS
jgi:hypothetical protein